MRKIILSLFILLTMAWLAKAQLEGLGLHGLFRLESRRFSDLGMDVHTTRPLTDGAMTYCSDCKTPATPGEKCAGGGSGAEAHRIRGQWVCF